MKHEQTRWLIGAQAAVFCALLLSVPGAQAVDKAVSPVIVARSSIGVSLTIHERVRVSGVKNGGNLDFSSFPNDAVGAVDVCVYRSVTGGYGVTALGNHSMNDAFFMSTSPGGDGAQVGYTVSFGGVQLHPGQREENFVGSPDSGNCNQQANARLEVAVDGHGASGSRDTRGLSDVLTLVFEAR